MSNQVLTEHEKLAVDQYNSASFEEGDFSSDFPLVEFPQPSSLGVTPAYVNAVLTSRPVLYWRFEDGDFGIIKNEIQDRFHGEIQGKINLFGELDNRSWLQLDGDLGAAIVSTEPLEDINEFGYTIEMWVNPLKFQRVALASLVDPEPHPSLENPFYYNHHHLAYVELMNVNSGYVHAANSFRFLHRWPAGTEAAIGTNIFEPGYLPGHWVHIVAVRTAGNQLRGSEQRLYINGEFMGSEAVKQNELDEDGYQFVLGRLDPIRNDRGLVGLLDEVALYPHALSEAEIQEHYRLVMP